MDARRPPAKMTILQVRISVVDGEVILRELPWLYQLYTKELLDLASSTTGNTHVIADRLESSININVLDGIGACYEWHLDTNPLTGILFVTTHLTNDGGSLVFDTLDKGKVSVLPESGKFILLTLGGFATM